MLQVFSVTDCSGSRPLWKGNTGEFDVGDSRPLQLFHTAVYSHDELAKSRTLIVATLKKPLSDARVCTWE